jgi:hypothetical protein
VSGQFFLGKKLECAVPFHVNGIPKVAVNRRKYGNDDAALMVVGYIVDLLANRKFCHRDPGIIGAIISLRMS